MSELHSGAPAAGRAPGRSQAGLHPLGGSAGVSAGRGAVVVRGVVKVHGTTTVLHGVDLAIGAGEFFVLLGPSGSGKTTTLRILAGLESVAAGTVLMDGVDVTDKEPGERDVAMVFQSYALYPHMTVAQNIGFPLKMVGRSASDITAAVADAAAKVGLSDLLARRPGQLSGGQQQRVALARAIVREPLLFLLDEPLSNLDAKLRLETRIELKKLQRTLGVTTVYVTHDQEEAMTLADRVAVFMDGRIVQVATPSAIYARPAHVSVAGFIGTPPMNLLPGTWQGDRVAIDGAGSLTVGATRAAGECAVTLGVRPTDLRVIEAASAAGGTITAGPAATIELIEELGDSRIVYLRLGPHRLKAKSDAALAAREGDTVTIGFAPDAAHLFDRDSGARLN